MNHDHSDEGIDTDKIKNIIVSVLILIMIIGAIITVHEYVKVRPYKSICEKNPRERYKEKCTTHNDCISKCSTRLYEQDHP